MHAPFDKASGVRVDLLGWYIMLYSLGLQELELRLIDPSLVLLNCSCKAVCLVMHQL
jgi:hypothetical protein